MAKRACGCYRVCQSSSQTPRVGSQGPNSSPSFPRPRTCAPPSDAHLRSSSPALPRRRSRTRCGQPSTSGLSWARSDLPSSRWAALPFLRSRAVISRVCAPLWGLAPPARYTSEPRCTLPLLLPDARPRASRRCHPRSTRTRRRSTRSTSAPSCSSACATEGGRARQGAWRAGAATACVPSPFVHSRVS